MRQILLVAITAAISISGYSQNFTGGYFHKEENLSEAYYFWEDGEFSWFRFTNDKKEYGKGTYAYRHDTLTLNFGKTRRKFDIKSSQSFPLNSKTAVVEVTGVTTGGRPIKGVRSILKKSGVILTTDSSGYSKAEIKDPIPTDEIRFEMEGYEGYGTIDTDVNLKGQSNYFVIVIDDRTVYRENQVQTLGIKRVGRSMAIVYAGEVIKFGKISKGRFLDFYHGVE